MFSIVSRSTFTANTGSQLFGGTVYKTWNNGRNGLVVANDDWTIGGGGFETSDFNNGHCLGNINTNDYDGLSNTKTLFDASNPTGSVCNFITPRDLWYYTRINFEYWSENDGYGDWYIPSKNELEELYSSSLMPAPYSSYNGNYLSSTTGNVVFGAPTRAYVLSFNTGTWTWTTDVPDYYKLRPIRRF